VKEEVRGVREEVRGVRERGEEKRRGRRARCEENKK
jgi:hypothetical protein